MSRSYTVGRDNAGRADILLPGKTISAMHAELIIESNGTMRIRDLGSSNGTVIKRGAQKIKLGSNTVSLVPGDILLFGGIEFASDSLLAKVYSGGSRPIQAKDFSDSQYERKMIRCPSCGSVTPAGGPCVECGYTG